MLVVFFLIQFERKIKTNNNSFFIQSQPSYGTKNEACHLRAEDVEKISLAKFNENDPIQHMMKVLFGCGLYAGFRGNQEHTFFNIKQINQGHYPEKHENPDLAGLPYISIDNMLDKTNKLSVHNSYLRQTGNSMRFPCDFDDDNNFGAALVRLVEKMSPGQTCIYCKVATTSYIASLQRMGHMKALFFPAKPLGAKTITKLFKDDANLLGLSPSFRAHSLRSAFITMLANDPSVSISETMSAARHTSVSASMNYQLADGISETNRLVAIGQLKSCSASESPRKKLKAAVPTSSAVERKVEAGPMKSHGDRSDEKDGLFAEEYISWESSRTTDEVSSAAWALVDLPQSCEKEADDDEDFICLNGRKEQEDNEVPSMTQYAMNDLREDLQELKLQMAESDAKKKNVAEKPKPPSANQRMIASLSAEVQKLKRKLEDRSDNELYRDSIISSVEEERDEYKRQLQYEREELYRVKRENMEFEQFLKSRHPDDGPRRPIWFGRRMMR